jgi:hypothetical protein
MDSTALVLVGAAVAVFAIAVGAMAIGVATTGRCLRGSCGGPEVRGASGERLSCDDCPNRRGGGSVSG